MNSGACSAPRFGREDVAVPLAALGQRCEQIDTGVVREGIGDRHAIGFGARVANVAAEREFLHSRRVRCQTQQRERVGDDRRIGLMSAIPFEHGELRRMQGAALAIAEHAGEIEDARLARRQQLLGREFRRSVEITPMPRAAGLHRIGFEGMQMRLIAGRDHQRAALDFGEALGLEPGARGGLDPAASDQRRAPVGVDVGRPPGIWAHSRGSWTFGAPLL